MDIHRIDLVIVNDRTQARTGERNFRLGIFFLQIPCMHAGGKGVLAEVVQSKQRAESHAAHSASQRPFLGIQAIWKDPLMPCQMQRLIFIRMIGFLKDRHIVCSAFMKIRIILRIHRIDFQADDPKIFPRNLTCLSDILHR